MEKQKTAVEWLINEIDPNLLVTEKVRLAVHQAKQMEKDQIVSFGEWYSGMEKEKVDRAYQRYLNETFK